jgi:hypothetical protein
MGAGFDPMDFAAYAARALRVLAIESRREARATLRSGDGQPAQQIAR